MGVVGRGVSCLRRVWSWLSAGLVTWAVWREWAFCVRAQALRAVWRVRPQVGQVVCPGLNAPFGARCFLTEALARLNEDGAHLVLMHLMALGAF